MASSSAPVPLTASLELLTRVASMYYLDDLTQEAIASRLGLSRPKVGRLLSQAKEAGIVQITVNLHPGLAMPLETELAERFELSQVIVVADQPDEDAFRDRSGRDVIDLLDRVLDEGSTLAIGMGRNVKAVSQQSAVLRPRRCTVVTGIGGSALVGGGLNSNDVVSRMADALGGTAEGLYAPAYAPSKDVRDAFLGHDDVARTLEHARAADVAVVGIGDANVESLVVRLGCITPDEMVRLREDGAVGDILGSFFNVAGEPIAEWIAERVVGLTRDDLRRIPNVIAVAWEPAKAAAILGALNSGLVDTLVTSASTARRVLELAD
jgi:DNA-binding transcriptional regulator LsrR (DeoR family)